ncbi:hypothetical protein Pla100_50700 [Neorhodopirellula pilleata]|uniref:Uncharacterized protein n=1 Tax=Neorhodopirellula pilleata TaxID=2714738 RepID=A0A5C5ZVQ8_9BACT|nr:hypothetical protein Pla100_50700 [Neorhodopirellula pilleata]
MPYSVSPFQGTSEGLRFGGEKILNDRHQTSTLLDWRCFLFV